VLLVLSNRARASCDEFKPAVGVCTQLYNEKLAEQQKTQKNGEVHRNDSGKSSRGGDGELWQPTPEFILRLLKLRDEAQQTPAIREALKIAR